MTKTLVRIAAGLSFAACLLAHVQNVNAYQGPPAGAVVFRGTLGASGKLAIQMRLRREGDKLTGSYFYETVGKDLSLRGTIDAAGNFQLQEFDAAGAQTGLFKGAWKGPQCDDCGETLTGKWTRPDGTRALEFVLGAVPIYFEGDVRLVSKTQRESARRGKWGGHEISAEYPQLVGAGANVSKFNEAVRALVAKELADYRKQFGDDAGQGGELDLSYYVSFADESLVSVDFTDYWFYFGAGPRMAAARTFNYDLARGRALGLADLFKPSSDYLKVISDACNKDLRRQFKGEGFPDAERIGASVEDVVGDEKKWLVSRDGFVVVFDSMQFGPSGSGEHTVTVPFGALREAVRPDGPLARFAR
ncbi:MAG TPA: RsiV family protein [Pyrinomonadaceae bacterium]|nr:RsiV family protein [Pyrinomonadaceae bacterium]